MNLWGIPGKYASSYHLRKMDGKCPYCTNPIESGYSICERHRRSRAENRASRTRIGMCMRCPEKVAPGTVSCPRHLEMQRIDQLRRVNERRNSGRCVNCTSPVYEGRKICSACAKGRYYSRVESHRCTCCGHDLPEGFALKKCEPCLAKYRLKKERWVQRKKLEMQQLL